MKQLAARRARQLAHRVAHSFKLHAIQRSEVVLIPQQEIHVAFVHAIVDGGLDMKDVQLLINDLAESPNLVV